MRNSVESAEWRAEFRTLANESEPPAADDLPLTGKVAATEVADGKREKVIGYRYFNVVQIV